MLRSFDNGTHLAQILYYCSGQEMLDLSCRHGPKSLLGGSLKGSTFNGRINNQLCRCRIAAPTRSIDFLIWSRQLPHRSLFVRLKPLQWSLRVISAVDGDKQGGTNADSWLNCRDTALTGLLRRST